MGIVASATAQTLEFNEWDAWLEANPEPAHWQDQRDLLGSIEGLPEVSKMIVIFWSGMFDHEPLSNLDVAKLLAPEGVTLSGVENLLGHLARRSPEFVRQLKVIRGRDQVKQPPRKIQEVPLRGFH